MASTSALALTLAGLLFSQSAHAANIIWDGNLNSNNSGDWGTTAGNELNWGGDVNPGTGDVAQLLDVTTGTRTVTLQNATTVQALTMTQTTSGAVNQLTLNAGLTLTNQTALSLTPAVGEPQSLVVNLNGQTITMSNSTNFGTTTHTLNGTWNFNGAGSSLIATGTGNQQTHNFNVENTLNVSANATIGRDNGGTGGGNNLANDVNFNFGTASDVNVTSGTLTLIKRFRSDTNGSDLLVNNSGAFDIASGASVQLRRDNLSAGGTTQATTFTNNSTGVVTLGGTLDFFRAGTGTVVNSVVNSGTFIVNGADAFVNRSGGNTVAFTNNSTGTLRGNSANDTLDYDNLLTSTRMTITSSGVVSAGAGHNGTGLASVGTLSLQDIDLTFTGVDSRLRLDIGGTGAAQFDVLSLIAGDNITAGLLTLDSVNTKLDLYYVNGFVPTSGFSINILNYGSVSGTFDLANNLSIFGATGLGASAANYSIAYGANTATLTLIPEPSTYALLGIGLGALFILRRVRHTGTKS
ncbi:MAG: PEP-CTERM sorting domain-containing protein [Candidatus Competibacteraceae bacterium]|nr:PEP-CTERM sorting domain-containing protein [Candidatus Competibacteraceae bacterium]